MVAERINVSVGSTRWYLARPDRSKGLSATHRRLTSLWQWARGKHLAQDVDEPAAPALHPRGPVEVDPKECALLVLGCQPAVLDGLADADALILKISAAIDILRLHGGHVAFVRIALDDLDYRFTPSTNKEFSALTRQGRFKNGAPESAIHPAFPVQSSDIVLRSTRLGAFSTTDLDEQLTNLGVTTLIVLGADTSGALLSTIREAADRDYRLIVLADCCADPDTETHQLLMERALPRQAEITTATVLYLSLAADKVVKQRNIPTGAAPQTT